MNEVFASNLTIDLNKRMAAFKAAIVFNVYPFTNALLCH